jgi:hypothetical protein
MTKDDQIIVIVCTPPLPPHRSYDPLLDEAAGLGHKTWSCVEASRGGALAQAQASELPSE